MSIQVPSPFGSFTKSLVQPAIKEQVAIPSIETLQKLVNSGCGDVAEQVIKQHDLPFKIEEGKIVPNLKGTEAELKKFISVSKVCEQLKQDVRVLANVQDEVLITGETGTGKELIAKAMIGNRTGQFVVANCAGLPDALIESELFGHMRGAFTGAESQKQGLFAIAKGGVMFLDEIGELPLSVQAKLLRAVQYKKIRRVGANQEEDIDCKFVCATHRDLKKMVREGTFREDLYARISTFEIHIPTLRERTEDVLALLSQSEDGRAFMAALTKTGKGISDIELSLNVRSVQRCVKRYKVLGKLILS